jgi:NAD(P)-dependent dehydrogenase (short-subunit alcohol dehydrogenase family)
MTTQVVLITGGLTGIGRAAAVAFAKKGAKVVVSGRGDEVGKALAKELRALGAEAEFINADVRKEDDVRALVDKTIARFGRLDVAVNNAGTEGQVGSIIGQTAESYAATFDTNVLGVILILARGDADLVAFGRFFTSNADLPERLRHDWPLTPYRREAFWGGDERWYSDFQPYRAAPDPRAADAYARFPINP